MTLSGDNTDLPLASLNPRKLLVGVRVARVVSIRSQTGNQHSCNQSRDEERRKRRFIRARQIEARTHRERPKSACQNESAKGGAIDLSKRAKTKISADQVGDDVHFRAQTQADQESAHERSGRRCRLKQADPHGHASKKHGCKTRSKEPVQQVARSYAAYQYRRACE